MLLSDSPYTCTSSTAWRRWRVGHERELEREGRSLEQAGVVLAEDGLAAPNRRGRGAWGPGRLPERRPQGVAEQGFEVWERVGKPLRDSLVGSASRSASPLVELHLKYIQILRLENYDSFRVP